jgi:hypothetical protein
MIFSYLGRNNVPLHINDLYGSPDFARDEESTGRSKMGKQFNHESWESRKSSFCQQYKSFLDVKNSNY